MNQLDARGALNKSIILTEILYIQLANTEVKVTNVCPGPVKTEVSKNALTRDGSKFGETDKLIENRMSVQRYGVYVT